jgi:hypothetical protein
MPCWKCGLAARCRRFAGRWWSDDYPPHDEATDGGSVLRYVCCRIRAREQRGQTFQVVEHYAAKVNRRKLGQAVVLKMAARNNA